MPSPPPPAPEPAETITVRRWSDCKHRRKDADGAPVGYRERSFKQLADAVRSGQWATLCAEIRAAGDDKDRGALKQRLPVVNGSRLLLFDVDALDGATVPALPATLLAHPAVAGVWRSPSGKGWHIYALLDRETTDDEYKFAHDAAAHTLGLGRWCRENGAKFDDRKDRAGVLFVSHDPDAHTAGSVVPFVVPHYVAEPTQPEPAAYRLPDGHYDPRRTDPERIRAALAALDADSYPTWIRAGMCLSELGAEGQQLWHQWSQRSRKYDAQQAAEKWATFTPGEGVGIGTLIVDARAQGWRDPWQRTSGGSGGDWTNPDDYSKPPPDLDEAAAQAAQAAAIAAFLAATRDGLEAQDPPAALVSAGTRAVLWQGCRHVISGPRYGGKSWVGVWCAAETVRAGGRAIIIDADDGNMTATRLLALGASDVLDSGQLVVVSPALVYPRSERDTSNAQRLTGALAWLDEADKPSLCVLDTLTSAGLETGGDNAAPWLEERLGVFRRRGHATLAVAHLPKNKPDAADPIGSIGQGAWFDVSYTLRTKQGTSRDVDASSTLTLIARKIRHTAIAEGERWAVFTLDKLDDERSRLTAAPWQPPQAAEPSADDPEGTTSKRSGDVRLVADVLDKAAEPLSVRSVADAAGITHHRAKKALSEMAHNGWAHRSAGAHGAHLWTITRDTPNNGITDAGREAIREARTPPAGQLAIPPAGDGEDLFDHLEAVFGAEHVAEIDDDGDAF